MTERPTDGHDDARMELVVYWIVGVEVGATERGPWGYGEVVGAWQAEVE